MRRNMRERAEVDPLVSVEGLDVTFGSGSGATRALADVSLQIMSGQSLGLVGESGSGKSTLAKAMVGINPISGGRIVIAGEDIGIGRGAARVDRTLLQLIPQDPYSSLSPRRTAGQAIAEALDPQRADVRRHRDAIVEWLERVELDAGAVDKYPYEFSGGQRQRIAIARALCIKPRLVIADEITSALDLSVQAEVLRLLATLRAELDLTMLFISHNLAVVRHVSDRVAVLYQGELVEEGEVEQVFHEPRAEYTRNLLDSVPGRPGFHVREDRAQGHADDRTEGER